MVVIIRTVIFVVNMQTQDYYSSVVLSHSRKQDVILRSYSALITQSFIKYSFIYLFVIPLWWEEWCPTTSANTFPSIFPSSLPSFLSSFLPSLLSTVPPDFSNRTHSFTYESRMSNRSRIKAWARHCSLQIVFFWDHTHLVDVGVIKDRRRKKCFKLFLCL